MLVNTRAERHTEFVAKLNLMDDDDAKWQAQLAQLKAEMDAFVEGQHQQRFAQACENLGERITRLEERKADPV
jgi:hypothetical protein